MKSTDSNGLQPLLRRVIVESPYAGDVERNITYARRAIRDCLRRGEAPIASHLLFTQPGVLRDDVPEERAQGIAAGQAWIECADAILFYVDFGMSNGMRETAEYVSRIGLRSKIEIRKLGDTDVTTWPTTDADLSQTASGQPGAPSAESGGAEPADAAATA